VGHTSTKLDRKPLPLKKAEFDKIVRRSGGPYRCGLCGAQHFSIGIAIGATDSGRMVKTGWCCKSKLRDPLYWVQYGDFTHVIPMADVSADTLKTLDDVFLRNRAEDVVDLTPKD
jgi:hypothetical protein